MTQSVSVGDCLQILNHRIYRRKHSHRYSHGSPPYTDSEIHSIRRLLGNGSKRSQRHPVKMPPAPHNSWLGFTRDYDDDDDHRHNNTDEDDYDDDDDDGAESSLFDTSIFHDNTDPNIFKLPSVFAGTSPPRGLDRLGPRHERVVPTVSERTFIDSNLRQKGYYTDRYDDVSNGHYPNNRRLHHSPVQDAGTSAAPISSFSSVTSLPPLDPEQRDLISLKMDNRNSDNNNNNIVDDDDDEKRRQGHLKDDDDISKDVGVELMSSMMGVMSLESELTRAGSLLMDENFVPMSVTITKLSQERNENNNAASSPATGITKENGRPAKIKNNRKNSNNNSRDTYSIKNDTGNCTCKDPRPILDTSRSPCPCCLRTGSQHETGCPQKESRSNKNMEAILLCNLCGKSIENRKRKDKRNKKQKDGTNRQLSGSGFSRNPTTPETAIHRFQSQDSADFHHRQKCSSGKEKEEGDAEQPSFKTRNGDPSSGEHRVRFDENVTTLHIFPDDNGEDINGLSQVERHYENLSGDGEVVKSSRKSKNKKLFVKRKDVRLPKVRQSINIPNLGVSVHAMAYGLALKDARIEADIRNTRRRKGKGTQSCEFSGTMFSYFPLLKRPLSENDKTNIGVSAQETRKVTGKNYKNMRHIFGKVKLADYYPGGKKWRDI